MMKFCHFKNYIYLLAEEIIFPTSGEMSRNFQYLSSYDSKLPAKRATNLNENKLKISLKSKKCLLYFLGAPRAAKRPAAPLNVFKSVRLLVFSGSQELIQAVSPHTYNIYGLLGCGHDCINCFQKK